jgi:hypothetical protein
MPFQSRLFAVVLLAGATCAYAAGQPPLPDGYLLVGLDGEFQKTAPGLYTFMFDNPIKTAKGSIMSGHEIEILPSTTLEYMLRDLGSKPHMGLRLWGTVTVYRGRNYIFPSYYLQVAAPVEPAPAEPNKPAAGELSPTGGPMPAINDANDEIRIPEELMKELKATRRVVDVAPAPAPSEPDRAAPAAPVETGDAFIVGRTGLLTFNPDDSSWSFKFDGLGRNVSRISFRMLPCEVLETMQVQRKPSALSPIRYQMAGVVTKFQGNYYILPSRVVRAYNYGNLGQ